MNLVYERRDDDLVILIATNTSDKVTETNWFLRYENLTIVESKDGTISKDERGKMFIPNPDKMYLEPGKFSIIVLRCKDTNMDSVKFTFENPKTFGLYYEEDFTKIPTIKEVFGLYYYYPRAQSRGYNKANFPNPNCITLDNGITFYGSEPTFARVLASVFNDIKYELTFEYFSSLDDSEILRIGDTYKFSAQGNYKKVKLTFEFGGNLNIIIDDYLREIHRLPRIEDDRFTFIDFGILDNGGNFMEVKFKNLKLIKTE